MQFIDHQHRLFFSKSVQQPLLRAAVVVVNEQLFRL